MSRFFWISIVMALTCLSSALYGQRPTGGSPIPLPATEPDTAARPPKIKYSYKPTGLRIGGNIFRLAQSAVDKNRTRWDVTSDIDFHKYMLEVSYGRASNMIQNDSLNYSNSGSYLRIGGDINFMKDKKEANALVIGLKYVSGTYNETLEFEDEDALFGNTTQQLANNGLRSSWMEANGGMKVRLWEQLYVGFYFRYRFGRVVKGDREFGTYEIPGYGLEENRNKMGFDYYIFWRIPFKKSPKIDGVE